MKVTKELQKQIIDAGCYPPRHQRGCPKNYARVFPTLLAAKGKSIPEIKREVREIYDNTPCECKE